LLASITFLFAVAVSMPDGLAANPLCNEAGYGTVYEQCLNDGNSHSHCVYNTAIFQCNCEGGIFQPGGPMGSCLQPE
jgi:hypothetical protein